MNHTVVLGRIFHCPVCGAEVIVIRSASQEMHPHCCNVPMKPLPKAADVYVCAVCGAEVARIKAKSDALGLVCCHQPMKLRAAA